MLQVLLKYTQNHFDRINQGYLKILYQTLFITAYFSLFRVSELTAGEHPILARDIHIADNKRKMLFILHSSKTHGLDALPQSVKISSTRAKQSYLVYNRSSRKDMYYSCPYEMLRTYVRRRPTYLIDSEPLFHISGPNCSETNTHEIHIKENFAGSQFRQEAL